ncbi:RecQ family ATP-dependent DNA helicase [Paucihalobacter ruber]|uniref:ATP-dependent DNA helicase RecQ n=1 Tax=Paucihalobacter ruber TaxID=2567861 RepID=A0A506PJB3_9FLAO|nr:RecQ family ATP-dependent DNA helicase [Paucihalobacter ruber]TPV33187.1 RecQ family ATP-dependent DNA helicase [Paucihalobacter ruber]
MSHPINILERYWQHTSFRPFQEDIIEAVLNNNDVLAILPTGGGKSVCFQIPALIKPGICIVISPLVALMKDQVNDLKSKGIKAMAITGGISYNDLDTMLDNCIYGNYKFLYLSPERLQQSLVKERIQQMNVNLIAVDEAHCISQWGHDFRPAYKHIRTLRELQPSVNVIALTATAKSIVANEIISDLDMLDAQVFKASFERQNIAYHNVFTEDKYYHLERILKQEPGAGIIYVRSRRASVEISHFLNTCGFKSSFFHGGLTKDEKQNRLTNWLNDTTPMMVATTAFGMGINKANVRTIIHFNLPESIESYYQESGRAGRDGKASSAYILIKKDDDAHLKKQFLSNLPDTNFLKLAYKKLNNYFGIAYGEGQETSHYFNFLEFCNTYQLPTEVTFNAFKIFDKHSIISFNQEFNHQCKVQVIVTSNAVFSYLQKQPQQSLVLKALLRTYGGIFDFDTQINPGLIAKKIELSQDALLKHLSILEKDGIINLTQQKTDAEITFLVPREDDITINMIAKDVEAQHNVKREQIEAVISYVFNQSECLNLQLLAYFGEKETKTCGKCSVCLQKITARDTSQPLEVLKEITVLLKGESLSSRAISTRLNYSNQIIINALRLGLELNLLTITSENTYQIIK